MNPFSATEVAVYHSEGDVWYKLGDEPWKVRDVERGKPAPVFAKVRAMCYSEAYEKLFGHAVVLPPQTKNPHRGE